MRNKIDDILYFMTVWIASFAILLQIIKIVLTLTYGN